MSNFIQNLQEVPIQITLISLIFLVGFIFIFVVKSTKNTAYPSFQTKTLTYASMCIALSFILSYIKLFSMPQGGSVTLGSMVPLILFAFIVGPKVGILTGLAYGFLQFFQDAYAAHWLSIILDYPLAFACLGLAGIVPHSIKSMPVRFVLGSFLAVGGRFIMHVISGAVFFGMYAPEGVNPWIYSVIYNSSFLTIEYFSTLLIGIVILSTPIYKTLKVQFKA